MRQLKSSDIPKLRRHLLKKQNGICPICGKEIKDPVLDHHHKKKIKGTGQIRGVICRTCNVFLAKCENNASRYLISQNELPSILIRLSKYLSRPHLPYIHPSEAPKRKILTKSSYNKLVSIHSKSAISGKIQPYRLTPKGKPAQGLTKPLQRLFEIYKITPEFYNE